ncbi:MAG TPA: GNAT family N-acetyltransferase [Myxococcaceae bacterium]|nr:GNAT family N-acetyltransferase [Myxococcaceae bacterium]
MPVPHIPTTAIPPIDTERLTLRGHGLEDFTESAAMWADPEVTRHIGGKPFSAEEVWTRLLRYVGEVGFADYKRNIEPSLGGVPEIGWALASWARGKGFATEAVRAAVAWGCGALRVRAHCMFDHERTTYKGQPILIFER